MNSQQQARESGSAQAYSPDYSSPMSSPSILQARFGPGSSTNTNKYMPWKKENQFDGPLPVFQNHEDSQGLMIPQVTVGGSETTGAGGAILSDISDELLIKQLQLNVNDKNLTEYTSLVH